MRSILLRIGERESGPDVYAAASGVAVIAIAMLVIGPTLALTLFPGAPFGLTPVLSWVLGGALTTAFVLFANRRSPGALRLGSTGLSTLFVMLAGIGAAIALDVLSLGVTGSFLAAPELAAMVYGARGGLLDWLAALAFMALVQPVTEELVFRGVAFPWLRQSLGGWAGLVITALAYAAFHWLAYPPLYPETVSLLAGQWYGLVLPFLAGLFIGAVRAYTGSTRSAIAAHAAFGLFAALKAFAIASPS
jgi:membrane protease YdiL (CAAX protease family)